jgi:hypothetical protein
MIGSAWGHGGKAARAAWAQGLPLLLLFLACASDLVAVGGGYRDRRLGYTIGSPEGASGGWQRVAVDGAALAFRRSGPDTMILQTHCGGPVADPALMARQLVIGVRDRTLRQAGPVAIDTHPGWSQTFDTLQEGVAVRVKTVTLVVDDCTFDWVLASAGSFESAEVAFDAWTRSFHYVGTAESKG